MSAPEFWNDQNAAQAVINEANGLKDQVNEFEKLSSAYEDIEVAYELVKEENDDDMMKDIVKDLKSLVKDLNDFELTLLLSDPYDKNNAILELHPGAGGTESQDWASMLLRMYTRYAERQGYKVETLDYLPGDEAGVKSVTLSIKGHNAYGYLKAEKGVHRLVRISPFDSSGRRHTSFVSCEVMPELNDDAAIEIR
ncbi:peptide chain release factor 2, partial [Fictibacillus aquaticus]